MKSLCLRSAALCWLAALTLALSACQPAEPRADSLEPLALLKLRFERPGEPQDLDITAIEDDKGRKAADRSVLRATVHPLQVAVLDDGHAVLLTELRSTQDCRNCPGIMGAYFYERDARGWRLTQSQDALLTHGGNGQIGKLQLHTLAPGHQAATLEWGDCWQGNCGAWLSVVSLRPGQAQELTKPIAVMVDTDGADEACSALDRPATKPSNPQDEEERPPPQVCYQIRSTWQFQGPRLWVDFTGRVREAQDGTLQAPRAIRQRAVYEIQNNTLKLVEGENPIQGF